jgi:hypothetical protein
VWLARSARVSRLATPDKRKTPLTYSVTFGWAVPAATTQVIRL